ncbi:MAG: hypothetical protein NVSMB9_08810 [Isosphaeraceae bacterium]
MNVSNRSIPVTVSRQTVEKEPRVGSTSEPLREPRGYNTPLIDIHEGAEGLVLQADLPGVTENNIRIQLEDNVLSLHAQVSSPVPEGARLLHEEYRVGDFFRSFILSDEVDRSKIAAELKNGVLRLVLPRAERARTRRIEIKS